MVAWIVANWVGILTALLAIDQALIPIFPKVPFFAKAKDVLSSAAPKQ